jgi:hypothetical protein
MYGSEAWNISDQKKRKSRYHTLNTNAPTHPSSVITSDTELPLPITTYDKIITKKRTEGKNIT